MTRSISVSTSTTLSLHASKSTRTTTRPPTTSLSSRIQMGVSYQSHLEQRSTMTIPTYAENGTINALPYAFQRLTTTASDALANRSTGNPVQSRTGLIRPAFRPSDDACIHEFFIPANVIFAHYLNTTSRILTTGTNTDLTKDRPPCPPLSPQESHNAALFPIPFTATSTPTKSTATEEENVMDDAVIPSILFVPLIGYRIQNDCVYQATRALLLSDHNP